MNQSLLLFAPIKMDPDFAKKVRIVQELCEARGLTCRVPTPDPPPFDFESMITDIRESAYLVADLSHGRPSCYYELGLIEASRRSAVLVAERGTQIFLHRGLSKVSFYASIDQYSALIKQAIDNQTE